MSIGDEMPHGCKPAGSDSCQHCFRPGLAEMGWMDEEINNRRHNRKKQNGLPEPINLE